MIMGMKEKHIRSLIDKYFSGQTSLREEQELSEFFRSGEVPEEFRGIAPLFAFRDASAYGGEAPRTKSRRCAVALTIVAAAAVAAAVVCTAVIPRSLKENNDIRMGMSPAAMAENMQRVLDMCGGSVTSLSAKPAGNAALVTATLADGTARTYIMTCDDGEGSASFIALNE